MRYRYRIASCALALIALTACGENEPVVMPDVTDARLDLALSDIERAGFGDEVEVVGGGVFGVVDESNWVVCEQVPAAGEDMGDVPRLVVDRSCDSEADVEADVDTEVETEVEAAQAEQEEADRGDRRKKSDRNRVDRVASTFVMPPVVGMVLQDAQDLLQAQGSYVLTQTDATGAERFQVLDSGWKVCWQDPAAGSEVDLAYLVDLGVVKLDESCP